MMFTFEILGVDCLPWDRHFGVHRSRIVGGSSCSFKQRPQATQLHRQHTEHCRGQEKGGACWLTSLRWARAFHLLGDVSLKV